MEKKTNNTKPQTPRPALEKEMCRCLDTPPIKLMHVLTKWPVHCMNCNLEVPIETLAQQVIDELNHWNEIYHAIYVLWLESGAYEEWAREQLIDITSVVNIQGREVQHSLNKLRRCYYWYFQDESADSYCPLRSCPVCGEALQDYTTGIFLQRVCKKDGIVVVGEPALGIE